jgi:hypothetical protein
MALAKEIESHRTAGIAADVTIGERITGCKNLKKDYQLGWNGKNEEGIMCSTNTLGGQAFPLRGKAIRGRLR